MAIKIIMKNKSEKNGNRNLIYLSTIDLQKFND